MTTTVLALFNQAGGVGKTTLTMNLGYHLAQRGHPVLLLDMDPQGSLTAFMGLEPDDLGKTIYDAIISEQPLPILAGLHGMDLVPANIGLSAAELQLVNMEYREVRLQEALDPVRQRYRFILIDCPPSLGLLSYLSLVASTHILVPVETHFKAFKGTDLLLETVARIRKRGNPRLQLAGFVPTRYASTNSQDKRTLAAIQEQFAPAGRIFPAIPRTTALVDASEQQVPLALHHRHHPVVSLFEALAADLESLP